MKFVKKNHLNIKQMLVFLWHLFESTETYSASEYRICVPSKNGPLPLKYLKKYLQN